MRPAPQRAQRRAGTLVRDRASGRLTDGHEWTTLPQTLKTGKPMRGGAWGRPKTVLKVQPFIF